jgi:sigma-B regulation protein RsbU (phosphoserine phosphatase)
VFDAVHRRILEDTDAKQFVTVFYGILDPTTGSLTYANAGHNPPLLFSAQGGPKPKELFNTGPPLGLRMFPDMSWGHGTVQLDRGDVLVLYTDGITEAQDADLTFFEEERLVEVAGNNAGRSAHEIEDAILADVRGFTGSAAQQDDITLFVVVRE